MIPKTIHYCWFGGNELSPLALKCISSWKKHCPDYEIQEWNEHNFDINLNLFASEAHAAKKWAFVSDVARLYILYNHGGIYMDTDVEILKPIDEFLIHGAFSGFERKEYIPTGIMGSASNNRWIKMLLDYYDNKHFKLSENEYATTPNVVYITNITKQNYNFRPNGKYHDLADVVIYPSEYFCPKSCDTDELNITENTYAIHHFSASWLDEKQKINREARKKYINIFGVKLGSYIFAAIDVFKTKGINGIFTKIKKFTVNRRETK